MKEIFNQPAARQRASPISGSQESSSAGAPWRSIQLSARLCCLLCQRFLIHQPIAQVEIPPKLLPTVATISSVISSCTLCWSSRISSASEPPGSRVEESSAEIKRAVKEVSIV